MHHALPTSALPTSASLLFLCCLPLLQELQDIFTKMSNLGDQLGNLRQAAAGVAAESGAAAGISQEGSAAAASADAADAVTGGASSP
jgi:hypothetical protein